MSTTADIQHWIVSIARQAALPGADALDIPAAASAKEAWAEVEAACQMKSEEVTGLVANHFRLARADFSTAELAATRLVPGGLARRLGVLVFHCTDRMVTVATADPVSFEAEKDITDFTGRTVHFEIASPGELERAILDAYGPPDTWVSTHRLPALGDAGPPRILVVDDDADARLLLRTILERRGYEVDEAESGTEALSRMEGVSLVTLDLRMKGISGLEVLRQIRAREDTAATPVIVATGVDDPAAELMLFEAGADDFVVKPVDTPRFLMRVEAVLRRYGVHRRSD